MIDIVLMLRVCAKFLILRVKHHPAMIRRPLILKLSKSNGSIGYMFTFVSDIHDGIFEHTTEYKILVEWNKLSEALLLISRTKFPFISHPSSAGLVMYESISENEPISPIRLSDDEMVEWMVQEGGWIDSQHAREFIADVSLNAPKWNGEKGGRYEHPLYQNRKNMDKRILKFIRLAERLNRRHVQLRNLYRLSR